ncbi:MAG: hypothetical protein AAFW98_13105 [Pseudomonadota bacterium]
MSEVKERLVMGVSAFGVWARSGGRKSARGVGLAALVGVLAGCGTGTITTAQTTVGEFFRTNSNEQETIDPSLLAPDIVCPQVRIQPNTESVRRDDGSGDRDELRWQASITTTARECKQAADGTAIRVGVAGRIVEGPKGAPSTVELPVRIAVREGGEVTYSRLHAVSVARSGASQDWAFVEESIVVDDPARTEVVVGFDE